MILRFCRRDEGGLHALNDTIVLDTENMRWVHPEVHGEKPLPRNAAVMAPVQSKDGSLQLLLHGGWLPFQVQCLCDHLHVGVLPRFPVPTYLFGAGDIQRYMAVEWPRCIVVKSADATACVESRCTSALGLLCVEVPCIRQSFLSQIQAPARAGQQLAVLVFCQALGTLRGLNPLPSWSRNYYCPPFAGTVRGMWYQSRKGPLN